MKRVFLIVLLSLAAAGLAGAQMTRPSTNALGAHFNYGRGCTACHLPHSGHRRKRRRAIGQFCLGHDPPLG